MAMTERVPRFVWFLLKFLPPRIAYSLGLGSVVGNVVLLLETIGRKSGLPRVTPLQYDEIDGMIYVASARGVKADWYQNLVVNPTVNLTIGSRQFQGYADPMTDPSEVADFLELRLQRHPKLIGTILRIQGLGPTPTREQLLQYAGHRALVAIRPAMDN